MFLCFQRIHNFSALICGFNFHMLIMKFRIGESYG
jgi:hypothetical protein